MITLLPVPLSILWREVHPEEEIGGEVEARFFDATPMDLTEISLCINNYFGEDPKIKI
jgi:hypothetical protein